MKIKTYTPELETLKFYFNETKENPWSMYNNLTWSEVIKTFNEKGFNEAKELIRQKDIFAYRRDEAECGNI